MSSQQPYSVLIIDDDDVSRSMLRFILTNQHRYTVVGEADNGGKGIALVQAMQPDIVCLDINLPDCSGLDLLQKIKAQWPQIIVLMVTGSSQSDAMLRAVQDGASGYFVKPFHPVTLLDTVAQAIAHRP